MRSFFAHVMIGFAVLTCIGAGVLTFYLCHGTHETDRLQYIEEFKPYGTDYSCEIYKDTVTGKQLIYSTKSGTWYPLDEELKQ